MKVNVPDTAHVVVIGPTGCGKSIVANRVRQFLELEFNAVTHCNDPDIQQGSAAVEGIADWERDKIRNTTWIITEENQSRGV